MQALKMMENGTNNRNGKMTGPGEKQSGTSTFHPVMLIFQPCCLAFSSRALSIVPLYRMNNQMDRYNQSSTINKQ